MEKHFSQTKQSIFNLEKIRAAYEQTEQYEAYDKAKQLHKKYNIKETEILLEEAAQLLLKTQEAQIFLQTVEHHETNLDTSHIFSDNTLAKHIAMTETQEYLQYQEAKAMHEQYNTADTLEILNICKIDLQNTKEGQEFLYATEQESPEIKFNSEAEFIEKMTNNNDRTRIIIIKASENQNSSHPFDFSGQSEEEIEARIKHAQDLKKRSKLAWKAVKNTLEFQRYLVADAQYKKDNSLRNFVERKLSKRLLENTQEALEHCKARADVRLLSAMHKGYIPPIIVEQNYPSCQINYIGQEKMMHKLNLKDLHIRTKNHF
jgi:hypothetical protein